MTISTEWTLKERLAVVAAIAARIESLAIANALKYRAEIAQAAFIARSVAEMPAVSCEANRDAILKAAKEAEC